MRERLQALAARIDALSLRERVLLFLAVVAVLYVLWDQTLMTPLDRERRAIEAAIRQASERIAQLDREATEILRRHREDPDAALRARIGTLERQIAEVDERLRALTVDLIPPREMARVLEAVLARDRGLRLVRLENLGTRPLIEPGGEDREGRGGTAADGPAAAADGEAPGAVPRIYRHDLRMEFEGTFLDTLRYLQALERLPWRFFWDSVAIEVERHPRARVRIQVHTLSLEEGWIGA